MVIPSLLCRSTTIVLKRTFAQAATQAPVNKMADQKFQESGVVSDVIKNAPVEVLQVKYPSGAQPNLGNELKPREVKDQPAVHWKAQEKELYTLLMTDPDAPSRESPKNAEWKHWLVVNIPGNKIKDGQVMAEYVGSGPPEKTGLHRYVILAYKQSGKLSLSDEVLDKYTAGGRAQWKVQKFAEENKLGDPVAGNFYQAQWDDSVPELYKQFKN